MKNGVPLKKLKMILLWFCSDNATQRQINIILCLPRNTQNFCLNIFLIRRIFSEINTC